MELKCVLMRNGLLKGKASERIYPRVANYTQMPSEQFVELLSANYKLTKGEIKSVLAAVSELLALEIGSGHSVVIEGLGTFSISMAGGAEADAKGVMRLKDAAVSGVNFLPAKSLKNALKDTTFTLVNHEVNDATRLTADEALGLARRVAEEKGVFICRDYAKAAGVSYDYARRTLAALVEEGKLTYDRVSRPKVYRVG